jgi:DNA-binding LacI/PurR family transcriptional regulator
MRELLRRNHDLTAVFASNDRMAIGALNALLRAGLRVPEDVSLIGYDDIPQATVMFPALTTIAQPKSEMGRTSVGLLLERIRHRGEVIDPRRVVLPVELVVRESCGPPREGKLRPSVMA